MTFEEFIESVQSLCWSQEERELVEMVWQVAQEVERERVTAIMVKYVRDDNYAQWNEAVKTAVREINGGTQKDEASDNDHM
jgi:hypothetical protein